MKELSLKNKFVQLDFLFGYCSLSYKNIILTKNLGIYSSIYHEQKWLDSRFATWQAIEVTRNNLKLYGEWIDTPHRQTWNFKLEDNILYWDIICENLDKFTIDMIQQNFMLNDMYTYWSVKNYADGKFPEFFTNYKGLLWDRIWSMPQIEGAEVVLGSRRVNLPDFRWISPATELNNLIAIENTDPKNSARIVQVLFVNPSETPFKGDYSIKLQAIIKIEEKNDIKS